MKYPIIELENKKFSCGKRIPITEFNYARYYIKFFLTGDIEINDVLDILKKFGKIVEMTWKRLGNTAIKTGEYSVYLEITNTENVNLIPPYLEIGG